MFATQSSRQRSQKKKKLHKQAPVHKSCRLRSELMINPNGHLQVINVIGCQLTLHQNNHSLWNTNQTASPWCTDYFSSLIWRLIRGQRRQKRGGIFSLASRCTKWCHQIYKYSLCSLQTDRNSSFLDNHVSIFATLTGVRLLLCCVAQMNATWMTSSKH